MEISFLEMLKGELMILLIIAPFLIIAAMIVVKVGRDNMIRHRREEAEYNTLYNRIESLVDSEVFYRSRKEIEGMLNELKDLKHKNTEKTVVLCCKFYLKIQRVEQPVNQI